MRGTEKVASKVPDFKKSRRGNRKVKPEDEEKKAAASKKDDVEPPEVEPPEVEPKTAEPDEPNDSERKSLPGSGKKFKKCRQRGGKAENRCPPVS